MARHMSTNDRRNARGARVQAPARGEKNAAPGAQAAPQAGRPRGGAAYGQRPVVRTLVTLLVAAAACAVIVALGELGDFEDPVEDGDTFEANALIKARAALAEVGLDSVADDSGLVVDALGGAPGILSARWAGTHGDDASNN